MPFSSRLSLLFCALMLLLLHGFLPHQHEQSLAQGLTAPWTSFPVQQIDLGEGHLEYLSLPETADEEVLEVQKEDEKCKPLKVKVLHQVLGFWTLPFSVLAQGNLPPPSLGFHRVTKLKTQSLALAFRRGPPVL